MEVELIALASTSMKAKCLRNLLIEILLGSKSLHSLVIHCDIQDAIYKARSNIYTEKSKHI
jgi:hypothetical protein